MKRSGRASVQPHDAANGAFLKWDYPQLPSILIEFSIFDHPAEWASVELDARDSLGLFRSNESVHNRLSHTGHDEEPFQKT